jgi:hypothetical protein
MFARAGATDDQSGRRNAVVLSGLALPFLIVPDVVVLADWAHQGRGRFAPSLKGR